MEQPQIDYKQTLLQANKGLEQIVDQISKLDKNDLPSHLKFFKLMYEYCEIVDSIKKVLDGIYDNFSYEVLPELFKDLEIDSISLHGRNFILSGQMYCSIKKDNEEEAFNWLRQNGYASLVKENVNAKQLTSCMNEYFEEFAKEPPECISRFKREYISIRKK